MPPLSFEQFLDEHEIRQLSHRNARALDRGDREAWSELFTQDAILIRSGRAPSAYQEIVEIPSVQLRRYAKTWHGVQTQNISVDGDEAEGEVYCIARHVYTDYHNVPGSFPFSLAHDILIRYQDRYRKDSGTRRIESRRVEVDLREVRQVTLFDGAVPPGEAAPRG
jgi:hypothetical protein